MYNGNEQGSGRPRAGLVIPTMYVYVVIGIIAVIVVSLVGGLLSAGVQAYFALAAGILLLLANIRDLVRPAYGQIAGGAALMNTMIGAALVFFFLGGAFGWLWYIPALLMLLLALPLGMQRAKVYTAYLDTARTVAGGVRRAVGGKVRFP
ncbi:MAG TPA: hypothetical protein PKC19_02145 [Roseiflexaceae bacterium]|nr:hypothetical protein [Roseiflexaceae bacterium]